MPFVRVRGVDLFYDAHGAGRHVIVAHGALGSISFGEQFGLSPAALAARGVRVIAYDARGHGRSGYTRDAADYEKSALAADLLGLMDALGVASASLCGASMGATTALILALAHPHRVEKLVLRSPAPFGDDMIVPRRRARGLALSYRLLGVSLTARVGALMSAAGTADRRRALLRQQRPAAIVPALRGFLAEPLSPERLHEIAAPALVLAHGDDRFHPLRSGEILLHRLPNADLCVAPSPTFWHDRSDGLAAIVAAFVSGDAGDLDGHPALRGCTVRRRRQEATHTVERSQSTDCWSNVLR